MTYQELTIHQKINAKSNCIEFYSVTARPLLQRVIQRDPLCFFPFDRIAVKSNSRFDLGWNQSYH